MSNDDNTQLRTYKLSVHLSSQNDKLSTDTKFSNTSKAASNNDARSLNTFFENWPDGLDDTIASGQSGFEKKMTTSKPYSYISYTDSINLHQSNDTEEFDTNLKCPLLAIPIPNSIIEEADAKSKQPLHSLNDIHDTAIVGAYLSKLLPRIHPALTCLQPCALLRRTTFINNATQHTIEESATEIPQNSFQLLILSINNKTTAGKEIIQDCSLLNGSDESDTHLKNDCFGNSNDFDTLQKIMNEVNGEPIVRTSARNPSAVIQVIPISRVIFYDPFDTEYFCQDECDTQEKFQRTALSNPFSSKSDRSNREYNNNLVTKPAWLSEDLQRKEKKSPKSGTQFVKRWDANDEDQTLEDIAQSSTLELPLCPVCIYRIEPQRLGFPQPKEHRRCTQQCDQARKNNQTAFCNNMEFLSPWSWPSYCKTCYILQERLTLSGAQPQLRLDSYAHGMRATPFSSNTPNKICDRIKCYKCGIEETLWVCLTCSLVGCGRYSHGHAREHFHSTCHPFSLELATQRIWDYKTSSFIQRDDLLNCPFMQGLLGATNRAAYHGAALGTDKKSCGRRVPTRHRTIGTAPKKAVMVGEEYEALLQSVLEDQAQHYQGQISRLQADLTAQDIDREDMSKEEVMEVEALEIEISKLRVEVDKTSSRVIEAQAQEAGHREKSNALLREQGVVKQLLDKIKEEAVKEQEQGKKIVEGLEQEISDLKSFISMRQQVAQNQELSNAQICGTSGKQKSSGKKRGSRKSRR